MEKLRDFAKLATVISNDYRTNFEKFATVAREYYRAKKVNRDLEWPPCFAEKLVKLNMRQEVYDVYYNKQQRGEHSPSSIPKQELQEYDSVFITEEGQTQVTKILVEGDAGIGKTTLCTLISVDWAEHRKLQQYKLLLLLPLRDKRVTSVSSVVELLQLYHPNKFVCETVANGFLYRDFGKQVLIIADGWDELEESRQKEGFICELLFKNAIHSATVLITSRPTASVALHKRGYPYYIDHFVEIDGFDEKGIEQYIKSAFSKDWERKKQEGLLQQMKENPLLRSICQVPINCAIICHMWRHDETLPSSMTLTDLYTKIILHFMLRAFQKSFPLLGLESLINFDAIPQDMQECFWFLCKCAYDALKGDKYVFLKEDLKAIFPPALENQQNELFTFGLMQSTKAFLPNDVGMGTSFHFLHRMFQEYLSALHILKQPSGTHTELMKPYAYTSRMAIVMRFVVGLGSTGRSVSSKMFPLLCKTVCDVFEINYRLRVFPVGWTNDLVIHGIYEASKGPVKDYLSKLVFGDNFTFAFPRNAYDCATVVTAIDHFNEAIKSTSKNATTVSFKFDSCHLNENLLINLAVALYNTEGKLPVKTFIIQNNKLSDEAICMLMNLAALAFKSLKRLCLAANLLGAEAVSSISEYLKESSIEHLTLSYNSLGTSGILALQNVIKADSLANLTDLQLKNCSLVSSKLCAALFKVLSDHCTCLKQLDISENHLEDPVLAGKSIGTLLQEHKTLSDLYANEICLGEEGITALTNVILTNDCAIHISVLALQRNGIQSVGVSLLAKCIQSLHLSISDGLYLDGNSIKLEGVVSLSAVFNTKIISMSNCQLTSTGDDRECLMESLSKMPQIESCLELILDSNCFAGQYIRVLAEFIRICPKLSSLSCAKCQIDSKDLKYILNNYSLSELETWWLQENRLGDFGCSLLITAVKSHLQKVTGIFIHENANITNDRLFKSLDNEVAKHRPAGDIIEQVLTKVMPGVPYDKLKVLVKKYEAYDNHTDDEQDPVLLWDDYCRRGEEQRQLAEKIIGWTMSFKNESWSKTLMETTAVSMKTQKLSAEVVAEVGRIQRPDYLPPKESDKEENEPSEQMVEKEDNQHENQGVIENSHSSPVIPPSAVSNLVTQFLRNEQGVTSDLCSAVTEFTQSPLGQVMIKEIVGGAQGVGSPVNTSQELSKAAQVFFNGQGKEEQNLPAIMNSMLQQLTAVQDFDYNAVDSSTILNEDDLLCVIKEVSDLKSQYYQIGVGLGLPSKELEAIKTMHHNINLDQALTEVLLVWLRQNYDVDRYGPPTWQSLVKAVDSPPCGPNFVLATAITSRHGTESPRDD